MKTTTFKYSVVAAAIGATLTLGAAMVNPAFAQSADGSLRGEVVTTQDQELAGATITIRNVETGYSRSVTAAQDGSYRFARLPVGSYEVSASFDGFQRSVIDNVEVRIGTATVVDLTMTAGDVERISVSGARLSTIDTRSSESGLNISAQQLERVPVPRDLASVATLAPGVAAGTRFGGISFGGSSVGENAIFLNGLNISDVETGVGYASVPFAFFKDFQVKTGGYSVEYGRTTGGVVSAVTKSGGNEFEFGGDIYWTPDSLRGEGKDFFDAEGDRTINRSDDKTDSYRGNIWASGPIIQDKLFFFALYEPRNSDLEYGSSDGRNMYYETSDDGFWGGKLDWIISADHTVEVMGFSDARTVEWDRYNEGAYADTSYLERGGTNWSATYTGYLTDNFMVKVLYGESERDYDLTNTAGMECNRVYDARISSHIGCTTSLRFDRRLNTRDALRIDAEYTLGDHLIRFGMDDEERVTEMNRRTTGPNGAYYTIYDTTPGSDVNGAIIPEGTDAYVYARSIETVGAYPTETKAFYLEDVWSLNPDMTLTMGLRWDEFTTSAADGTPFLEVDDMLAPRVGFAWDVNSDGTAKFFANAGRYYFPIANGMAARSAGGGISNDTINYYILEGLEETTTDSGYTNINPILGDQLGDTISFGGSGAGNFADEVDNDLDPIYQDELIIGYEARINDDWNYGVRGIYREFNNAIEDMKIDVNVPGCGNISGWVFANPGKMLTLQRECPDTGNVQNIAIDLGEVQSYGFDLDGDGNPDPIGGEQVQRKYYALEFVLDRVWDDVWQAHFSYTWSHSYGNYEGSVNSDTGNDIPGWTEAGDNVMYINSGWGNLPNDRRHQFKARGAYAIAEGMTVGANFSLMSGTPINARGQGNPFNDNTRYYLNYLCVDNCTGVADNSEREFMYIPKGMYGTTDWVAQLDLNFNYDVEINGFDLNFGIDVFNVFNSQVTTRVNEFLTTDVATRNDNFMSTVDAQGRRYVQLSAGFRF
ncbi:Oar protein [Pseudidiomarina sediminum]|uniref:Oar protein n=1 Tax=Pseudidiomarina sediminum TaxID=431675 RepID=A0A432ZAK8_9GAMM|nr:TonB-dependent receptor [Pseudidiomarina sediminum]RUO74954.1 Oar protein [Pseudidiomarina sediminum]